MSWASQAGRVRDDTLPIGQRVHALHSLVATHHAPLGFLGTAAHLRAVAGVRRWTWRRRRWTREQLLEALAALEGSRASHLAYRAAFAERRSTEKAEGRRRPTAGDVAALERAEWVKDVDRARTRAPSRRERGLG